ncbi:MAG: hypothetical protein C5B50_16195 [Verrucomicrobia bacterium]|nr:MAG: hypothetical protein C5B50_16195 [Verrucomicrobiota bacterium]
MKSSLIRIGLVLSSLGALTVARADFNPVPLTPGSFTYDSVVENTAPPPLANFVNVTMDNGTNNNGATWYEAGFCTNVPYLGLPPHGSTFISHNNPNITWLMPPSYVTNNVAFVGGANIPGTSPSILQTQVVSAVLNVAPSSQTAGLNLSILWGSGGSGTVVATINQADGNQQAVNINPTAAGGTGTLDWFNGSGAYEYIASSRLVIDGGNGPMDQFGSTTVTKLFRTDITLNDTASAVTNVTFTIGAAGFNCRFMAFGLSESTDGTHFSPLVVSGFNYDGVVETNVAAVKNPHIRNYTVTMDQGMQVGGNTWYEQGFGGEVNFGSNLLNSGGLNTTNGVVNVSAGAPFSGIPRAGTTFTAISNANHSFTMPASYNVNHCVFIGNYNTNVTVVTNLGLYCSPTYWPTAPVYNFGNIAIASPTTGYQKVSILGGAGNGPVVIAYTNQYAENSTDTGTFSVQDWFPSAATTGTTWAWIAAGRVSVGGGAPGLNNVNGSGQVVLTFSDIPVNSGLTLTNIALTYVSGGRCGLLAVSASTDGTTFSPIGISGYDAAIVVAKEQPVYPAGLFAYTTATMDNGTNNYANTWSEQGWDTNGIGSRTTYWNPLTHVTNLVPAGFPLHNTTISSVTDPAKHYQMPASYTSANSVLLDINHGVNNITPTTPGIFSAFALLNAGASIGAANTMTNQCILQHADGTAETNNFFGFDWFKTTAVPAGVQAAVAYIANGRAENRGGSETSLAGGTNGVGGVQANPRLFESFFVLTNLTSAVTNIIVKTNVPPGGGNWTTYVIAVSATKDSFIDAPLANAPTINQDAEYTRFEGQSVTMWSSTGGIPPTSVQWQFSPDFGLNWFNMANGPFVSGATTTNVTISSLGWTNSGTYRMYGCNVNGCVTNTPLTLRVFSTLADVTQPSDPVSVYEPNGGSSPNAEQVAAAIDNLVGVDTGGTPKYLNFGANNGAPFAGPVGLVVSPQSGKTTLSAMRLYCANDAIERDPADYLLEGSNDGGATFATISSGSLSLTTSRNANNPSAAPNALTQAVQEVHFNNPNGYSTYRLSFANVRNNTAANSMQIGEVELLGVVTPGCPTLLQNVVADVRVVVGASPNFSVRASGNPAPTYQWSRGGSPIPGATLNNYTLVNAQSGDSGATFSCVISNTGCGTPVTSGTSHLTVIPAPTAAYPTNVMHDGPVAWLRLGEGPDDGTGGGNNGVTAYDSWGGHNGYYSNSIIQSLGYSPGLDSDTAAYFGKSSGAYVPIGGVPDSAVEGIPGINFGKPAGQNGAFSAEAWVQGDPSLAAGGPVGGAGIITKGYGGGGEQFCLDAGGAAANGFAHTFRFFVRNAGSETAAIASTGGIGPEPGIWHHLVGVCDEANGTVTLYIDGVPQTPAAITPGAGILDSPQPVLVGARSVSSTTNNNLILYGTIDEAALYNSALSQARVQAHYYATTNISPPIAQTGGDLPTAPVYVLAGSPLTYVAGFLGTPPLTYQWSHNGSPIPGATTSVYSVAATGTNDSGNYTVQVCNNGGGSCTTSSTATVTVENMVDFNLAGAGWTANGTPSGGGFDGTSPDANYINTTAAGSEATSAFYNSQVYIGAFEATWTYQEGAAQSGGQGADGTAFVIQNDNRGTAALGGGGGQLGYNGITPSVALEFNIYPPNTVGYRFAMNGATPAGAAGAYLATTPVDIHNGGTLPANPISVTLLYNGATLFLSLTDTVSQASFHVSTNVNIPSIVGKNTALVGFTGATGGDSAQQTISNFRFFYPPPTLSVVNNNNGTITLSWPVQARGYTLLETSSFQPTSWTASAAVQAVVGNNIQATITLSGASKFYKLSLVD